MDDLLGDLEDVLDDKPKSRTKAAGGRPQTSVPAASGLDLDDLDEFLADKKPDKKPAARSGLTSFSPSGSALPPATAGKKKVDDDDDWDLDKPARRTGAPALSGFMGGAKEAKKK